ncbi:hypothetical protein C8F01DRAFT_1177076 [Mycena amicta]|nr:hypothetical protein C8F01DRAFT_1177076 [Mycena amicta]
MPNPVDDAPQDAGPIALPADAPATSGGRLRSFHRRVAYLSLVVLVAVSLVLWQHPPTVKKGTEELSVPPSRAYDSRLERYQTPESAAYCAEWGVGEDANEALAAFELPVDASLTFLLSRGPLHGEVHLFEDDDSSAPFKVAVSAHFREKEQLKATKACLMLSEGAKEHGVLFWAEPRHPHGDHRHDVRLNITLSVPRTSGTGKEGHNDLSTDLPLFTHKFGELFHFFSGTSFETIRLKSSNAEMDFGGLIARAAFIETSNAEAKGFFGGFELDVRTSNGKITTTSMMFGEAQGTESRANLWTSNAEIDARFALVTDYTENVLRANVRTSNAKMTIQNRLDADNSTLFLDASTSNGPVEVYLDSSFEGEYDLQTSLTTAHIDEDPQARDPLGRGREHVITRAKTGKRASGQIYWGKSGEGPSTGARLGEVKVNTSTAPVVLHI